MSTKINLLPDVRQAKMQDQQRRHLAISLVVGSVVGVAAILIVAFVVVQGQHLRINQLTSSISSKKQQVASYPDIKTILSLQAKSDALPGLYSQRTTMTKLLSILSSLEPQDVDFTAVSVTGPTLSITAEGKSYLAAARIANALKAANVTVGTGAQAGNKPFFTSVNLSAVTLSTDKTGYTITANIDPGATSGK